MLITIRSLKERRFAEPKERKREGRGEREEDGRSSREAGTVQGKNEMRFACVQEGRSSVISII